jgi:hypothetical protein
VRNFGLLRKLFDCLRHPLPLPKHILNLGFLGLGFRTEYLGFADQFVGVLVRVEIVRFRVWGLGFRVEYLGFPDQFVGVLVRVEIVGYVTSGELKRGHLQCRV